MEDFKISFATISRTTASTGPRSA